MSLEGSLCFTMLVLPTVSTLVGFSSELVSLISVFESSAISKSSPSSDSSSISIGTEQLSPLLRNLLSSFSLGFPGGKEYNGK